MRLGLELLGGEHRGHEDQQPEQRVVADFPEQRVHGFSPPWIHHFGHHFERKYQKSPPAMTAIAPRTMK